MKMKKNGITGIAIGVLMGAAMGFALDSIVLGISLGAMWCVVFYSLYSGEDDKDDAGDPPKNTGEEAGE